MSTWPFGIEWRAGLFVFSPFSPSSARVVVKGALYQPCKAITGFKGPCRCD